MNNILITHTTDTFRQIPVVFHRTDTTKRRDTALVHTTDAHKRRLPAAAHTTDTFKKKFNAVFHQTDVSKQKGPSVQHRVDASKRKEARIAHTADAGKQKTPSVQHTTDVFLVTTGSPASTLGVSAQAPLSTIPEFSKNAPLYISIGSGLSAIVGIPRMPTWNTAGRPKKPERGTAGFNTEIKKLEIWNGTVWHSVSLNRV